MRNFNRSRGMLLVDMLIAITLLAILLTLAVPSLQETIATNQLSTQINSFVTSVNLARNEAVKRNRTVALCKSANGTSCATSGNWEQGWIVFANTDNDSPAAVDAGETVLQVATALPTSYSLRGNTNAASSLSFRSTGDAQANAQVVLCQNNSLSRSRTVFVSIAGHIYLGQDSNHDKIPEDDNDVNITGCTP